jgi:hypothetical protein
MADDSHPGGRRRAGRDRPEAALGTREPGPAGDDEDEPARDELEPAGDDLEPAGEDEYEDEPAGDELEPAEGDHDEPVGDGYEAEEEPEPARADRPVARGSGDRSSGDRRRRRTPQGGAVRTARQAVKAALRQVMDLTGKQAESITNVERREDGWMIGIEVVEDRRIPSSADILASYEAIVDQDGELIAYRRVGRYIRGRSDSDGRLRHDLRKPGQHLPGRHAQRRPQQWRRPRHWPPVHQPWRHPGTGAGQGSRDRG